MSLKLQNGEKFSGANDLSIGKTFFTAWTYSIVFLITMIVVGGFALINHFNTLDYQRDLQHWKEKLNLVAESREVEISHFVAGNFSELRTLAENPSLKLYLAELKMPAQASNNTINEPAQKSYLRNLLLFTAQHGGFVGTSKIESIPANIPSESKSGLAVLDNDKQLIVSTSMNSGTLTQIMEHAKTQTLGADSIIDLQKDKDGMLYMGFSVPIYSIQGERNAAGQIGQIIALKAIDENLFGLLKQVGISEKTIEILLMRKENNQYISPLQDGTAPLEKYAEDTLSKNSIEKNNSSDVFSEYTDYRGKEVLSIARNVSGTPWQLITKIDKEEAFAQSNARRAGTVTVFALVVAVIALIIAALWWYSSSRRALMASGYFKELAATAQAHEKLLTLVANNQPEAIYILDENQNSHFANKSMAEMVNMSPTSIIGKKLADIVGAARAQQITKECEIALKTQQPIYMVQNILTANGEKIIRSGYVPLAEIPIPSLPAKTKGVLIVEQDISEVFFERERRVAILKQLIATLVNLVDRRDPFAANHSLLVSQVAYQIAVNMGLDDITIDTTKTAASLMNIGKILVPKVLLTKTSTLTDDEKNIIRESMETASELLKNIPFDGAVADTIRQWQEKWDGSGKLGLTAEEILISARIIAVANAFIGMVSPRSWRDAMTIDAANKFLLEQSGSYFDKRVVIALVNYVENQMGRAWLDGVLGNKKLAS